jgi:predicted Zn-dependent protease
VDASNSITTGTDFNFNHTSSQAAGITWAFGDYGDTGWDGTNLTTYNYGTCRIAHVDAWLNKYYLAQYQPGRAQSVAIHEDGHSIGMRHFTDGCVLHSIMHPSQHHAGVDHVSLGPARYAIGAAARRH